MLSEPGHRQVLGFSHGRIHVHSLDFWPSSLQDLLPDLLLGVSQYGSLGLWIPQEVDVFLDDQVESVLGRIALLNPRHSWTNLVINKAECGPGSKRPLPALPVNNHSLLQPGRASVVIFEPWSYARVQ